MLSQRKDYGARMRQGQVREDTQKAATGSICMQINIWKKTNHSEPETLQD